MTQPHRLGDRYEVGALLGRGGMAEVHRGRDLRLNRDVAIKMLRADLARDSSFQARFRREAQAAAALNHPSIVAVYDTGEDHGPNGVAVPYIVMEYVEGQTLREVLRAQGRLAPQRAMEITADICAALDFSHRNGIVHRDIKPGNVMITPRGAVKVMDFGIARALTDTGATMTSTQQVIGTAQYLSPEQARGENVDARSDVYSTGCLLYELVTGSPPFTGDSPVAVAYQHVREDPIPPSMVNREVPRTLDSIVLKAMAKNPANRYQSAGEMRADLGRALAGRAVVAEPVMLADERTAVMGAAAAGTAMLPPTPPEDVTPPEEEPSKYRALAYGLLALAVLLIVGGAAYGVTRLIGSNDNPTTSPTTLASSMPSTAPTTAPSTTSASPTPQQVLLPNLFNYTKEDAEKKLHDLGLVSSVQQAESSVDQKGKVIKQSPDVGYVDPGSVVTITIGQGPSEVTVPQITDVPEKTAKELLTNAGIDPANIKTVNQNNAKDKGIVFKSDPEPGTKVPASQAVVLYVSTGKLTVPNVRGDSYNDARAELQQAGFLNVAPPVYQETDQQEPGTVISQSPKQNSDQDPNTEITLYVAKAKPTQAPTTNPPTSDSPTTNPPSSGATSGAPSS
jgi:serine/threonine-protein kinase